eukprot:jgi/Bigna1/63917/fgenesh1_kg.63_\
MATTLPRRGWPVQIKAPVQWGDQDAYMHVNNCQFYRWWESAHIAYLQSIGIMLKGNAKDENGAIIARSECNFLKPVSFPDTVTVCCRATKLGNTSLSVEYLLLNKMGESCATGSAILVLFDYIAEAKYNINDELRAKVVDLENNAPDISTKG